MQQFELQNKRNFDKFAEMQDIVKPTQVTQNIHSLVQAYIGQFKVDRLKVQYNGANKNGHSISSTVPSATTKVPNLNLKLSKAKTIASWLVSLTTPNRKTRERRVLQRMQCATTVQMAKSTQLEDKKEVDSSKEMLFRSMWTEPPAQSSTQLTEQSKQQTFTTC